MPITRYKTLWRISTHFLGYHHLLIAILSIAIIAISIVVAGCTSHGLASIYLLSLSYVNRTTAVAVATYPEQANKNISAIFSNIANSSSLEVRVGYLGLCMRQNLDGWKCSRSARFLASNMGLRSASTGDPFNLIWIASNFRNKVVFDGLIFIAMSLSFLAILLLLTFPGWHTETEETGSEREVKPFPSKTVSYLATALVALASIFLFVSILWQHIVSAAAASMIGSLSYGAAGGTVGTSATALSWTAVFCQFLAFAGTVVMVLSIKVLAETFE